MEDLSPALGGTPEPAPAWTRFMDMASGGSRKLDYDLFFIEAPETEAKAVFYSRFGRSPDRVTCTCCGPDFSVGQDDTLEEASEYDRGEESLADWLKKANVKKDRPGFFRDKSFCLIRAEDIKPEERVGDVPAEGYVWAGS